MKEVTDTKALKQSQYAKKEKLNYDNDANVYQPLLDLLKNLKLFIKRHPASALAIIYLLSTLAGLLQLEFLLSSFGVKAASHILVEDLLLGVLASPVFFFQLGFYIIFTYLWVKFRSKKSKGVWSQLNVLLKALYWPQYRHPKSTFVITTIVVLLLYTFQAAKVKAIDIENGRNTSFVNLQLQNPIQVNGVMKSAFSNMSLIVSTSYYSFYYDKTTDKTVIIPHKNIALVEPAKKEKTHEKS